MRAGFRVEETFDASMYDFEHFHIEICFFL
uniref:Uncharacterized protein n=1 Tax=Arundo donax TaxID=35708 RepID=A0A0A9BD56_ARUDO